MNRFDLGDNFNCLYDNANKLCNTLDVAISIAHKNTEPFDYEAMQVTSDLVDAFNSVAQARGVLMGAVKTLNKKKGMISKLKEQPKPDL